MITTVAQMIAKEVMIGGIQVSQLKIIETKNEYAINTNRL